MKKFSLLLISLLLAACGLGDSDTSSDAGSSTVLGTDTGTDTGSSGSGSGSSTTASSTPAATSSSSSDGSTSTSGGSTMKGTAEATLNAPGFVPVTDSAPITVVVSGSKITFIVEDRKSEGTLNSDGTFTTSIPINEESGGITCTGTPTLEGKVEGNTVKGNISGTGTCASSNSNVPVTVTGTFSAKA